MDEMCRFRLIEREDLAFLVAGMNLPEVMERTLTAQPITEEELYVYTYRSKRDFWRCIELNGAVVGICAISRNHRFRREKPPQGHRYAGSILPTRRSA